SDHTGTHATPEQLTSPTYWTNHLRHPVRFHDLLQTATQTGTTTFLELGPDPILTAFATETLHTTNTDTGHTIHAIPTLRRNKPETTTALTAAAHLHTHGTPINWPATLPHNPQVIDLPTYAFQRERLWAQPPAGGAGDVSGLGLGSADQLREAEPVGENGLFHVKWSPLAPGSAGREAWAVLGERSLYDGLREAGVTTSLFADLGTLADAVDAGEPVPALVVLPVTGRSTPVTGAHRNVEHVLAALQHWLGDDRWHDTRLLVLTRDAVTTGDEPSDLTTAPVWGLTRSAQTESPGRVLLADLDDAPRSLENLPSAVAAALAADEPQFALRGGSALVPRLAPLPVPGILADGGVRADEETNAQAETEAGTVSGGGTGSQGEARRWDPDGTVLITGELGPLDAFLARHLVTAHGVRNLLLTGRRGAETPGADDLRAELTALGATVTVTAADVTDPAALTALLEAVPADHPLTAIVHTAGVTDDAPLASLTPERLHPVLAQKINSAWLLQHLTRDHSPAPAIVLFSSVSGLLGGAAQATYAAANTYLDALATQHPRTVSLAWGLWEQASGITARPTSADQARIARTGLRPLPTEQALALFDAAVFGRTPISVVVPTLLAASVDTAPAPLLRGLVKASRSDARTGAGVGPASLAGRLAGLDREGRAAVLLELVRGEVGAVLDHPAPDTIAGDRALLELGLDSLTSVELRNRLSTASGLRLPATLTFDHPTPQAIADLLDREIGDTAREAGGRAGRTGAQQTTGGLVTIYRQMHDAGKNAEAAELLLAASHVRGRFDAAARDRHAPAPIKLATGPGRVSLVCFPALSAISGPHEYSRLGQTFRDERNVYVVPPPGFTDGEDEALPDSLETFIQMNVEGLRACVGEDEPFVIVGRSMGGCVAHAVTVALEDQGLVPAGLALIDSYPIDAPDQEGLEWWLGSMIDGMLERIDRFDMTLHDSKLTRMGAYNRLFVGWQPKPVETPTLLLRAAEPLRGTVINPEGRLDWRAYWPVTHESVDIPGDHFTILEEHSDTTAQAIRSWISRPAV
ncbi:SDR family NAD(P)-dependent oxidoreductase, partial [Streptosporangium sp. NPDC051023]|uniref:SDR family NAD(P)-dependent oxidoreductase n=1 Tax=Streptosporangium sp. NPDC051023 TaxID=3155410 RepID=UPI00344CC8D7